MATFRAALSNLAQLRVNGARNNFDIHELPERITAAHLPALLVLPLELERDRLFKDRKEGLQTITFSGNAKTASFALTHLLLAAPAEIAPGIAPQLPRLVNLIDSYMAAMAKDITLGETLLTPARVAVDAGLFTWGEREFVGCAFRHIWLLAV